MQKLLNFNKITNVNEIMYKRRFEEPVQFQFVLFNDVLQNQRILGVSKTRRFGTRTFEMC